MLISKILLLILLAILNNLAFASDALNDGIIISSTSSLLMPKGQYSVAVKDFTVINDSLCPDPFFSIATSWAYVDSNHKHCHQMKLKIYYPIVKGNVRSPYNPYVISAWRNDIIHKAVLDPDQTELQYVLPMINNIKSYVALDGAIAVGKFPLVIFQPGFTYSSSDYENFITSLVSHGYIVLGINSYYNTSMMIDAKNLKANEPEVPSALFMKNANADIAKSDLKYVLDNISSMQKHTNDPIFHQMDLTRIGAFGHSLGAFSVYNNSVGSTKLSAAIALDLVGGKDFSDYKETSIPFLFFRSAGASKAEMAIFGKKARFYLGENEYLLFCAPDIKNNNYSMHNGFQDLVTLQYNHAVAFDFRLNKMKPYKVLGYVNGYTFTAEVNQEILLFFDYFIKRKPITVWDKCSSNHKDMLMFCNNSEASVEF
jgi:hypothetical protein